MVEAALVIPILVLLVFGLVEFGRAYNAQITDTHAAREGVRTYAITKDFNLGRDAAINAATSLSGGSITVTGTACETGEPVQLTVSYPHSYDIPLFGSNTLTLTATGVMRCGG